MRHPSIALLLMLVTTTLTGCGMGLERPEVNLVDLEPLESTLFEQRVRVSLRVLNPNDVDLSVRGMDLTLDVNGTRLARGLSSESFVVPRLGETEISMEATTTVFDLVRQVVALTDRSELAYEVRGRIYLDRGLGGKLSFRNASTLAPPAGGTVPNEASESAALDPPP